MATGTAAKPIGDWEEVSTPAASGNPTPVGEWEEQSAGPKPSFGRRAFDAVSHFASGFDESVNNNLNPVKLIQNDASAREGLGQQADRDWNNRLYEESLLHRAQSLLPGIGPITASVGEGSRRLSDRAADDLAHKRYGRAALHTAEAGLPIAGPLLDKSVQAIKSKDAKGMGEVVGDVVSLRAAPEAARLGKKAAIEGPTAIAKTVADITKVDPKIAAMKAWGPSPTNDTFGENLEPTLQGIRAAHGAEIKSNAEAIVASHKAIKSLQSGFDHYMTRGRSNKAIVIGDDIVKATWESVPDSLKREKPKVVQALMERTEKAYGGKRLSIDQADKLREEKTADLRSFYDKSTGNKIASILGGSPEAVVKAQRDAFATGLYRALDPENEGAGPRMIRQQIAGVIDVLDMARRRTNMAESSKPVSKFSAYAGAVPKAVQSIMGGQGLGYVKGADILNPETLLKGNVDPWVKKAFKAAGSKPFEIPKPGPWKYRLALPPATPRLGPWETPSATTSHPEPYMGRGMSPDIGTRRLGPATQTQQPGFAVGEDMVPITDPHTGRLTYVPKHYAKGQLPAEKTLGKRTSKPGFGRELTQAQIDAMEAVRRFNEERDQ